MSSRMGRICRPFTAWVAVLILLCAVPSFAQTTKGVTKSVTCPASGSSIAVVATTASRKDIAILNDSATDIRVGEFNGLTGQNLDDTNSFILKAGTSFVNSYPTVFIGAFNCMSTTASTVVVHFVEHKSP